jgi:hypothetical protein
MNEPPAQYFDTSTWDRRDVISGGSRMIRSAPPAPSSVSGPSGSAQVMDEWLARDWLSAADAGRFAAMMAHGNTRRAYGLGEGP